MGNGVYLTSHKKRKTAFWLCVFTGLFGGHYFYVGRTFRGILALFTFDFFIVGWLLDLGAISAGKFKDCNHLPLID